MLDTLARFIENAGAWSYVLAPLFMIVVAILPIPAEIPAMLNGMVFGAPTGVLVTWSGAMVGAVISFELARRFGRPLGARLLAASALEKTDRVALAAGWPGLLALRLVPTIAFTLVNWGAGLTAIPRWTFVWTTAVGIIPGTLLFTVSGSGLWILYRQHPALVPALSALLLLAIVYVIHRRRRGASPRS